ncbi:hypothetical protein [Paenibacillus kandeliae]|uniref:hypothetical protein n=1 Tax=Paenibacillus kandeliae TaxID=3231269 RepID=UPI00345850AE
MNLKKVWQWIKVSYLITYFIFIILFIFSLGVIMYGTLINKELLTNTVTMNTIALILGLISLPGAFIQLLSIPQINEKKKFKLECKCPNCRQLIEIKMIEE